jgi:hypothetical protein
MQNEWYFDGLRAREDQAIAALDEAAARGGAYGRAARLAVQVLHAMSELEAIATGSDPEAAEFAGKLLSALNGGDTDVT